MKTLIGNCERCDVMKPCDLHYVIEKDPCGAAEVITMYRDENKRLREALEEARGVFLMCIGTVPPIVDAALQPTPAADDGKKTITDGYTIWLERCPTCGGKMSVVRPGKAQCENCG